MRNEERTKNDAKRLRLIRFLTKVLLCILCTCSEKVYKRFKIANIFSVSLENEVSEYSDYVIFLTALEIRQLTRGNPLLGYR